MTAATIIRPHAGPQECFLATAADIAIYGGAAGGGKSWALLAEALRHVANPGYGSVIFRRTSPEITAEGGLWDESVKLYPQLGATPRISEHAWTFPSMASVGFGHMQYETDVLKWHSSQIALIGFDELTTFTEYQFWYMLSRNRSTCGVRPYVRATTNPTPEDDPVGGWVNRLIRWWIDQETGFPIPERSGVVRWFISRDGELYWGASREEIVARYGSPDLPPDHEDQPQPKSLTFVSAKLTDNPTMMRINPEYRANLLALPPVEQARLLGGNWKVRLSAGLVFKVDKLRERIIDTDDLPELTKLCRGWDLAATDGAGDYTAGVKLGTDGDGRYYILDAMIGQWESDRRDTRIRATAEADGKRCSIRLPQDPGQAGKSQVEYLSRKLAGFTYRFKPVTGDKVVRASPLSSAVNAGTVYLVRGDWNDRFLSRMDAFPTKGIPDDEIDAAADAFDELSQKRKFAFGSA